MFATIRAREPYDEHLPYSVVAGSFEMTTDVPIEPRGQRWVDHTHRTYWTVRNPDELERRLRNVLERFQHFWPNWHARAVRLWVTIYEAPAYPGPAAFQPTRIAVLGELLPDGTFRTMLGSYKQSSIDVKPRNVSLAPDARLVYYRDDVPTAIPIAAPLTGTRFELTGQKLPGNPRYFVAVSDGVPWLVASHETWVWR
jgi:hypothetical protein